MGERVVSKIDKVAVFMELTLWEAGDLKLYVSLVSTPGSWVHVPGCLGVGTIYYPPIGSNCPGISTHLSEH